MQDSVFTKIIKGEIPCHKLYEDEKTFVLLTIEPYVEAHTLVIPKKQIVTFEALTDDEYHALFATVKKIAQRMKDVYKVDRIFEMIAGFDVPHVHVHLMPVGDREMFHQAFVSRFSGTPPYLYDPSNQELARVAATLKLEGV